MVKAINKYWHYIFFALTTLAMVFALTRFKYIYGSTLDWNAQAYEIPEYLRNLFYDSGQLFGDFAFNLGGGQNIYYLSYYGYLSPIYFLSLLFPFIPMKSFIIAVNILILIISVILMYRWLKEKFTVKAAFFGALLFEFSGSFMFHSHRQTMFIIYMPFLILALKGVEKYFRQHKRGQLVICSFLVIMSNYFFSVTSIIVISIYAVAVYMNEQKNHSAMGFLTEGIKFALNMCIAVLMSAVLWLPTLKIILSGREATNVAVNLRDLLTPTFNGNAILYGNYSLGLTAVFIAAIAYGFISGKMHLRFLSVTFTLISFFGIFIYIFNGGMYLDGKIMIPFLPIAVYMCTYFAEKAFAREYEYKRLFLVFLIYSVAIGVTYVSESLYIYIIDSAVVLLLLGIHYYSRFREWILYGTAVMAVVICMTVNLNDRLVQIVPDRGSTLSSEEALAQLSEKDGHSMYRIGDFINVMDNLNHVFNMDHLSTSIYSSVSNTSYRGFYYNVFANETRFRNSAMIAQSGNPLFNIFMGEKYIIGEMGEKVPTGYHVAASKGNVLLYKNKNAYPIGYVSDDIMDISSYEKLPYPKNIKALMSYTVADTSSSGSIEETGKYNLKIIPLDISNVYEFTDGIREEKIGKNKYKLRVSYNKEDLDMGIEQKTKRTVTVKLKKPVKNKVIFIRTKVDNRNYYRQKKNLLGVTLYEKGSARGDVIIAVDGVINKLSHPNWKYNNKNYSFEFVTGSTGQTDHIDVSFYEGTYTVSDFEAYAMDYNAIKKARNNMDEMVIDKALTKGNRISGDIDVRQNGWFRLSIPYDEGFIIRVDGKEREYKATDTSFIGFPLEKGHHLIDIEYHAPLKKVGGYVSLAGMALLIAALIRQRKRYRR